MSFTFSDFITQDVHKWFPDLENKVQITLIEAGKKLLGTFDSKLSDYTMILFRKRKVDVRTGVSVKEVQRHHIVLTDGSVIPFGVVSNDNIFDNN
jgi:NADH:ubiquinone reductase (non-electrogenic)